LYWLTWRQHRLQILITLGFLVVLGVVLLVHGLSADGLAGGALNERFIPVYEVVSWLPVLPVLFGAFWGAPVLAREFERGTHKLMWTQSVTRWQWLAVKLGGLGAVVALAGLAFGFMVKAWLNAFGESHLASAFGNSGLFAISGIAPAAWWLFGFMLGAAAGATIRRMLPAIAVAIAVFVLALIGVFRYRESYGTPQAFDPSSVSEAELRSTLSDSIVVDGAGQDKVMQIIPGSHYWQFQWTEAALLLAVALVLGGVAVFGALRRRV
jgi:ABC-type transport system involved in multi-copper enzyme maturation permease subunit